MRLPKIEHPLFTMVLPSNKQTILYRPFLVKEEKILLIAAQSDNNSDITRAIKQIIVNCVQSEDFDISNSPLFDIEYIFLKIRASSVNNIIDLEYEDIEDNKKYKVTIDLDDIEVYFPDVSNVVEVNEASKLYLKYPKFETAVDISDTKMSTEDQLFVLIKGCLDKYVVEDEVYYFKDCTDDDVNEFLDQLDSATFTKIRTFIRSVPSIRYETGYTNSLGTKRKIVLDKLTDFFTFV